MVQRLILQQVVFAAELLYLWSSSLIKLSILSFHTRLAKDTVTPRFVLAVRISILFIVLYMITFTIVLFFTCQPFVSLPQMKVVRKSEANIMAELFLESDSSVHAPGRGEGVQLSIRRCLTLDQHWHKYLPGKLCHLHQKCASLTYFRIS